MKEALQTFEKELKSTEKSEKHKNKLFDHISLEWNSKNLSNDLYYQKCYQSYTQKNSSYSPSYEKQNI